MKKLAIALTMLACGFGVNSVYASGGVVGAPVQMASSGFFVTGDVGYGRLFSTNSDLNPVVPGGSYDRDSVGWSGGLGYNFAIDSFNMLGIEADYLRDGKSSYTSGGTTNNGTLNITSNSAAILFSFTTIWSNGVDFFFKVGPAYVWQNNDYSASTLVNGFTRTGSITYHQLEPMGVIGVGYYIMQNLNLFADATVIGGITPQDWNDIQQSGDVSTLDSSNHATALAAQFKVGLSYQF